MTNANSRYSWYVVVLCTVAYVFSFIDRQILALLIEPVKQDLQISDTQFSLLHGFAFSLFYATMGIPIARLADRKSRPMIISVGVFFWSIMTALCGLGQHFWHMFAARIGVGVGESALTPATYSMIRDLFPKEKLGIAYGVYSIGTLVGGAIAFLVGGAAIQWIAEANVAASLGLEGLAPWRITFIIVGLPGVLLALIMILTIRDPQRKGLDPNVAEITSLPISEVLAFIKQHKKAFTAIYLGTTFEAIAFFGLISWTPAVLLRKFDLTIYTVGLYMGSMLLVFGAAGILSAGRFVDYMHRKGRSDGAMRVLLIGSSCMLLPMIAYPLAGTIELTLLFLAPAIFFAGFGVPTSVSAMQLLAPTQMRAQISAIFLFINSMVAMGIGTSLVALTTDYVFADDLAVGKSLAIVTGMALIGSILLISKNLKSYGRSVDTMGGITGA